jgi:protein gp37
MATRHESNPLTPQFRGFARAGHWLGKVALIESELEKPLHWRKPKRVAVGLMGDLFRLPDADIDRIFAVMALCPQHTFLLLTKQARRMQEWATSKRWHFICEYKPGYSASVIMPLENVRFGVSAEDQVTLEDRVPWLLKTPAAHRWLSLEPLLGPVKFLPSWIAGYDYSGGYVMTAPRLDHVVVGGESGPGARPMHPDWVRQVRDQCVAAGVPFLFKQWGEFAPREQNHPDGQPMIRLTVAGRNGQDLANAGDGRDVWMQRVGKRAAGRMLDGRTWEGK